nr:sulfatase-like hydrolase/transferase [Streptococcus equi]
MIYILSESFADPARISGVQLAKDPIPEIHHIMEITTSGLMTSDGYGGGTANMEFQSLFGLPNITSIQRFRFCILMSFLS